MTDKELIQALRHCECNFEEDLTLRCWECPGKDDCDDVNMTCAAEKR